MFKLYVTTGFEFQEPSDWTYDFMTEAEAIGLAEAEYTMSLPDEAILRFQWGNDSPFIEYDFELRLWVLAEEQHHLTLTTT